VDLKMGEYREGVVQSESREGLMVDVGMEQPALLRERQYRVNERLTLQVVNVGGRVEVQAVSREDVSTYWGYTVKVEARPLGQFLADSNFDLIIATARLGSKFGKVAEMIGEKWRSAGQVLVVFGAPSRGLHEIAKAEGARLDALVDFVVNTIPAQGTATVRTEEALLATLAVFNERFNS
jgi:predicted SPOUT superfamily RNA methylase MTH1